MTDQLRPPIDSDDLKDAKEYLERLKGLEINPVSKPLHLRNALLGRTNAFARETFSHPPKNSLFNRRPLMQILM